MTTKPRVKGSRDFEVATIDLEEALSTGILELRMACAIARKLDLPCWDDANVTDRPHVQVVLNALEKNFEQDEDGWLEKVIDYVGQRVPFMLEQLKQTYHHYKTTKWLKNDYGDIHEFVFEHLEETSYSSPLALISLATYTLTQSPRAQLIYIIPWFIRYGAQEHITNDQMLNKFAIPYHDEYIVRLPGDELFEFLTSEKDQARIMARNKVKAELLEDTDE